MKSAIRLVCVAAVAFAVYWFGLRGGCGTRGAIACPDPALEQGVGVTVNAAAVEGIMVWDGHPLPLVIDTGKYTVRFWDVGVVWTQGLYNEAAVLAQVKGETTHGERGVPGAGQGGGDARAGTRRMSAHRRGFTGSYSSITAKYWTRSQAASRPTLTISRRLCFT
jgi:hypothetical protein